ncbi:MAG: 2-dehydropantoate 2-reductase [Candidatus Velthaea sp.]
MKIGIVGAGAIGTLFGYKLAANNDVFMLDIGRDLVDAINRDGLQLEGSEPRRVTATTDARDLYNVGALFVFVRATDTLRALRAFAGELNPSTAIVSLQNGVGNEEAIKTALGGHIALVLGATTESSLTLKAGAARPIGQGQTVVGSGGASPDTCNRIARLLDESGIRASTTYDIRPHLWGKLIANAAINPVAALLDRPNGVVLEDPNASEIARSLAQEAATVAAAVRIALPFSDPWSYVRTIVEQTADLRNSMVADLSGGHKTEIDFINGAVVATGRRAAVPTPYNETIVRLVKAREARY